jgi:hypothetical protein
MQDLPNQSQREVIVFRFHGGCRNGQDVRSDRPEEAREVELYWTLTWNGTIGRRINVESPDRPAFQPYQVTSKRIADNKVLVTCEHVGQ